MYDFKIDFSVSPWVFLLIIPLFAFAFFMYFRMKKKYRRTRNRILSLILHCLVTVLCVSILSGITFSFYEPNEQNELVLLVDASFSSGYAKDRVNKFVHEILVENGEKSRVSIVTFGFDQQVALEMGQHDPEKAYSAYLNAPLPDITATDIASALTYVWDPALDKSGGDGKAIIHYPETTKIVLISDGLETDRSAMNVVKSITMDGVQIDTSFYPANYQGDVWITKVTYPDRKYTVGETIPFSLEIRSAFEGVMDITFTDKSQNDVNTVSREGVKFSSGKQTVDFPYEFRASGHHELHFEISSETDPMPENNVWNMTYDIDEYTSVLVIEKYKDESLDLVDSLRKSAVNANVNIKVIQVGDGSGLPQSMGDLVAYDEVILVNIANKDMPVSFVTLLESYVGDYGGGVFTVGGYEKDDDGKVKMTKNEKGENVPVPHAYNKVDMKGSLYQQMLPVEITDYTPSVALAIIIDRSGSMESADSEFGKPLDLAIAGAVNALEALSPRDQVGIVTLQDHYTFKLDMTPMTQKKRIIKEIQDVAAGSGGGTMYGPSIDMAGQTLQTLLKAERKHILFFSDSQPADPYSSYNAIMQRHFKNDNITLTYISVVKPLTNDVIQLAENTGGSAHAIGGREVNKISDYLKEDLKLDGLTGAVKKDYSPAIQSYTTIVDGVSGNDLSGITMNGFFTSMAKGYGNVEVSLMAEYVPLYAQWKYGRGKVGSFMCDLEGYWSKQFLENDAGNKVLYNIMVSVVSQMAYSENIFSTTVIEDNYRTQISVYGFNINDEKGRKLVAFVNGPNDELEKFDLKEQSFSGNKFTFINKTQGVYEITIVKVPENFNLDSANSLAEIPKNSVYGYYITYRAFSYSREYDPASDSFADGRTLLVELSTRKLEEDADPAEKLVYDAETILNYFADIHIVYDPQRLFAVLAIVLMLLDIAIRKFKFKWLHEIIMTYKQRKVQFGEAVR